MFKIAVGNALKIKRATDNLFVDIIELPIIPRVGDTLPLHYENEIVTKVTLMPEKLLSEFNGIIPSDVDELQKLPGVGRKTANVIASVVFNKEAMAVDTHVFRVSNRIGLTDNSKTPLETEKTLVKHIPGHLLPIAHHWLILHGRYICTARKPKCLECGIREYCKYYSKKPE